MEAEDERCYAAFLAQQETGQEPEGPLLRVKNIRKQQLLACDLEKHREMAQLLEQQSKGESN